MRFRKLLVAALCAGFGLVQAQTVVPRLDEQGRKGDVARTAQERALAKFNAADEDKDGKLSKEEVAKPNIALALCILHHSDMHFSWRLNQRE